ncbi:hypothetical protein [Thalassospira sp. MCCC 1A03138]|uniref:hypothetical protein n=1 Tax=Thalassospira sp. MCCC 1A03138 TaxID=1470576 RepID=UPI000A1D5981|nr:hypothetical protein [Thalassospira sp. MCCC 1A03138]OSQ32258.1 hypothetical protein TH468_01090 [Thalassospira sp. MCCC 1A03138]
MNKKKIYESLPHISNVQSYLRVSDWLIAGNSENYTLYKKSIEGAEFELIVAKSENVRGWERSLADAIEQLADYLGRSIEEIISAILAIKFDVFRSRIADSLVRYDTIDMETAVEYVTCLKSFMVSSAAAELRREQLIKRAPPVAAEYGRKCRFGHTFKGSFGFVVESPVHFEAIPKPLIEPLDTSVFTELEAPFERKVIERIATGMRHLDLAAREDTTLPITDGYEQGLNANMLDDLLNLHEAAKLSRLSFDFQWSPQLPEVKIEQGFNFDFGSEKIEIMETASRELKRTTVPEREAVAGYVTDLHTDFDLRASDIFHDDRKVVVKISSQDYTQRRLHISLNEEDYGKALAAHKAGKLVSVIGKMEKRGRYWYLLDPERFQIISE